jgi:hypothetical protein
MQGKRSRAAAPLDGFARLWPVSYVWLDSQRLRVVKVAACLALIL